MNEKRLQARPREKEMKRCVSLGKGLTSCSRKILYPSVPGSGTYLFFLPRSYRSPNSRLATSSLANFVSTRTTHSLILIELYPPVSSVAVAFFSVAFRARKPVSLHSLAVYVTFLLLLLFSLALSLFLAAGKSLLRVSRVLVAKSPLPAPSPSSENSNA